MTAPHILLLEDNAADAELICREVNRALPEAVVHHAGTREDFQAALDNLRPDLVISDHNLGRGFSGRDALDLVRKADPDVPFVLVTGSLDEETAVEYMREGAADYLLKDRITRLGSAVQNSLERSRQKRALRRNQLLLRRVIDTTPSFIFVRDRDGRFVLANRSLAEYYDTTVEEMLGRRDADFNPHAEEVAAFLADDREVLTLRRTVRREETVTEPRTGERRWFHVIKTPLVLPGGEDALVLGIVADVTERKRLEEQFYQSQKMEAIGQLAGGVAHDFNNLLTVILGNVEFLLGDLPPDDKRREELSEVRDAAARAAGLTRQLLAFSRRQVVEARPLDLNALVTGVEKLLRRLLGEDVELSTALGPELGTVVADAGQLEQVLVNLAVNARDAMPEGGRLTIETANVELDEEYAASHISVVPGPHVMLAVSDTGVGMDEQTKLRIFDPFFTTKEPGKGTGLGLATVYGIVKQNGGNIWVYSERGRGTSFKIYFPRTEAVVRRITPGSMPAVEGGIETILLAEDEEAVRRLAQRVLEAQGYTVLAAATPAEALKLARRHEGTIDLLVTDVVMPGMSGPDLAREVVVERPDMRVLYVSGYTHDAVTRHRVLPEGATFLQKPFTAPALARRVRAVLDVTPPAA